jgi:glycosyltransferase involved in cell wall biosynthesis
MSVDGIAPALRGGAMSVSARPELSVLLPCRDAADTVGEAVQSILCEREVALELIAVDDGSRDASGRALAAAAAEDPRVRVIRTPGIGIARALQAAAEAARAPLLARMDADDVSLPGRLRAQLTALHANPELGAIGTRVEPFPDDAVAEGLRRYVSWQNSLLEAADHRRQLFVESPLCHPSVMLRADALARVGGYRDGLFPEDYDLWLRLDAAGYGLAKLSAVLLRWRHREDRATLRDPRYARERFLELKAPHLAHRLRARARPLDVWGAGPTGKRLARALEPHGVCASRFIDIDPRKIGGRARGAAVVAPSELRAPGEHWVVVALGARGARDQARTALDALGYREGEDYLCAS